MTIKSRLLVYLFILFFSQDIYVPHEVSIKLAQKISSNDVSVILRKSGDHRLSKKEDIKLLFVELDDLIHGSKEEVAELAETSHSQFSIQSRSIADVKDFKGE